MIGNLQNLGMQKCILPQEELDIQFAPTKSYFSGFFVRFHVYLREGNVVFFFGGGLKVSSWRKGIFSVWDLAFMKSHLTPSRLGGMQQQ